MNSESAFVGLPMSRIGLGLAALGRPGYLNLGHADDLAGDYRVEAMEKQAHLVLDEAYRLGLRYFDAAQSYGKAEEFLSSWLQSRNVPAKEVTVGSKWGYTYTADWQVTAAKHEVKEHSLEVLDHQWRLSKSRLAGHLRLYQIHSATFESGVLTNQEVLSKLAEIKQEGVLIGLTLSGPKQANVLREALKIRVAGDPLFDCVQATWNLLERSAGPALVEAHGHGLGVIVKEALANGRLTLRNQEPAFAKKIQVVRTEAKRLNTTVDALAMAAVLAQPWANVVLSGAAAVSHLQSNIKALEVTWSEALEEKFEAFSEPPEVYWGIRSRLKWN